MPLISKPITKLTMKYKGKGLFYTFEQDGKCIFHSDGACLFNTDYVDYDISKYNVVNIGNTVNQSLENMRKILNDTCDIKLHDAEKVVESKRIKDTLHLFLDDNGIETVINENYIISPDIKLFRNASNRLIKIVYEGVHIGMVAPCEGQYVWKDSKPVLRNI